MMFYSKMETNALLDMIYPLSPVKMVRESYSRYLQKLFTEVQVQFDDEEPAWIPYDTLLAMMRRIGNDD